MEELSPTSRRSASRSESAAPAEPRSALAALAVVIRHPAAAVLAIASVVASVGFVWLSRSQWFYQDEWRFLVERDAGSISSLLEPHNEHLSIVPIVLYRVLWNIVGLRSYLPYQLLSLTSHLLVVWLLWLLMVRVKVSPWSATFAVGLLLFYGAGSQNIVWAFQVGFLGGVIGGLACFVLADAHPTRRRTAAAIVAGAYGLLSAGTGLVTVAVAIAAVASRRGLRRALAVGIPLAVPYAIWWVRYQPAPPNRREGTPGELAEFVSAGLTRVFQTYAAHPLPGTAIAVACAIGVIAIVAGERRHLRAVLDQVAVPVIFAAGAVGFFGITARSRVVEFGPDFALRSRYSYVALAFLIPLIGLGIEGLRRRVPAASWAVCLVIALVLPASIRNTEVWAQPAVTPALLSATGHAPWLSSIEGDTHLFPDVTGSGAITVAWLGDAARDGRLPADLATPTGRLDAQALLAISTSQDASPGEPCPAVTQPTVITVGPANPAYTWGPLSAQVVDGREGHRSAPFDVSSLSTRRIDSIVDLELLVTPAPERLATLCGTIVP